LFVLYLTAEAQRNLANLRANSSQQKRYKAVTKALKFLAEDPHHRSLETHKFTSFQGPNGEEVFEVYAENNTPGAIRIFWFYGPSKGVITIIAITYHP
jgi:hypothetical protein